MIARTIQLPTFSECFELFDRFEMLDNIRAHSQVVARVAEEIVDHLADNAVLNGMVPDRQHVITGALLHDIAKTLCIETGCRHAEIGRQMVEELGYPEVAEIVAEHVVLKEHRSEQYKLGNFIAKEIVYYADKRVRHDQVVSLADRLEYIIDRYGDNDPRKEHYIKLNFQKTLELEAYIFAHLEFAPDSLPGRLASRPRFLL